MPLQPRFRRSAGSQRRFVDREEATAVFEEHWTAAGSALRVLNVTGVGGIGKSRFLRECQARVVGKSRTAHLDLQVPALREQDAALAVLRAQFGAQGLSFPRYDIAYLALWQRLHPHLQISLADIAARQESGILTDIADAVGGMPVFRTVSGLLQLTGQSSARFKRWRWLRNDETLHRLDELDPAELADAATFLFAEDLRRESGREQYLVTVDAYEALVGGSTRAGRSAGLDAWLRDLVSQLDTGLVLIASREPVGWQAYDTQWNAHLVHLPLGGLPMPARVELLEAHGVSDTRARTALARASSGVPFYLNLALDSNTDTSVVAVPGGQPTPAVSGEEILERFLQHVDPQAVRLLEVLAVARTIDPEIFHTVATAFGLSADRLTWETLTAYSFVQPAGTEQFQLHQLMAGELRERQTPETRQAVHRVLRTLWRRRADRAAAGTAGERRHVGARVREVAFHSLYAGDFTHTDLLAITDEIAASGGIRSLGGVVEDTRRYCAIAGRPRPDLETAARCVEAETAVLVGDAEHAELLTRDLGAVDGGNSAQVRLALAGADALRVLGRTSEALSRYLSLWQRATVPEGRSAALWAADLYMAGGRFRDAENLANGVSGTLDRDEHVLRGDTARLIHLGRRFAFDFPAARSCLDQAQLHYLEAGSAVCLANLVVNRAEFLAWTEPEHAVDVADEAIDTQRDIGALHELGKAHTARALALLRLGRTTEAESALDTALETLGRARYRSGTARAQLVKSLILLRRGERENARTTAEWAIREFEAAEVYPTLVLASLTTLRLAGLQSPSHAPSLARARAAIHPVDPLAALEGRVEAWVAGILGGRA
ncbi:aminoglycoside phosphotransferase family protein [Streptomyces sp. SID3343]|uniref:aminoglycoside phosphotransferase family protein n=1 Tax=Streptomyces sp. SID3343 TaxID=2690260 RepID=UPI00136F46A9|nr:aminoglycoside phosphotransferase family protein [Streptomyces sp. SID3343]MYV98402.1 aminoglycoside phosphotransferase family protein [Streptomyces sp. SID3343]